MTTREFLHVSVESLIWGLWLFVALVLDDGAEDGHEYDTSHVQVEPVAERGLVTGLDLLCESELVREATGIETDSTDEHVGTAEGSHENEHVLVEEEREDGRNDGAADRDAPENGLALSQVEDHVVEHDTDKETAPASKQGSANPLQFHHEETSDKANEN